MGGKNIKLPRRGKTRKISSFEINIRIMIKSPRNTRLRCRSGKSATRQQAQFYKGFVALFRWQHIGNSRQQARYVNDKVGLVLALTLAHLLAHLWVDRAGGGTASTLEHFNKRCSRISR